MWRLCLDILQPPKVHISPKLNMCEIKIGVWGLVPRLPFEHISCMMVRGGRSVCGRLFEVV